MAGSGESGAKEKGYFTTESTKDTKGSNDCVPNFVLFVSFVVREDGSLESSQFSKSEGSL